MSAAAAGSQPYWPAIQVLFVVDSTFYNGDFINTDDPGFDQCDRSGYMTPCEESNGIPFFVAHANDIAAGIAHANPQSRVSFAMMDDYSTYCNYGDCDGPLFHVDFGDFVSASEFGSMVRGTYQTSVLGGGYSCPDCDFWDNFLHAPTITTLWAAMAGGLISWSSDAHHVIVWMGDTAPRDPNYVQNYCVSGWDGGLSGGSCYSSACEPSYNAPTGASPPCLGWVTSQDGNASHSIAGVARTAPSCVQSLGGRCTIDTIDLVSTATDPYSVGWPPNAVTHQSGGGPGGLMVFQNVARVLAAGCDLATATGGSWDGPSWASCKNGASGSLQFVAHGSIAQPNTDNPSLSASFHSIAVGPVVDLAAAIGTDRPIFTFVPFGAIALAPNLQATAACTRNGTALASCQRQPSVVHASGATYLAWNFSTIPGQNVLFAGDTWTAEFDVVATGPPYTWVPVDACLTLTCRIAGSGAVAGLYTWAHYRPTGTAQPVTTSFGVSQVRVEFTPSALGPPASPPPPPPGFGPPAVGVPTQVGQPLSVPVTVQTGLGTVSLNATDVGLLAAGMTRVGLRNRQIAMKIGMKSGAVESRFDSGNRAGAPEIGRFE